MLAREDWERVLWEVALADWVAANLCEVAHYAWDRHLLHDPDAILSNFQQVDLDWFVSYAKFTTSFVRGALAAIRSADCSRAVVEPEPRKRRYLPYDQRTA